MIHNPIYLKKTASSVVPLDPVEEYTGTRPADWLPMPEPADNEIYLLVHIPDGSSSLLAFTVTLSDETSNYDTEFGTVTNGQFGMPGDSSPTSIPGRHNEVVECELYADSFGDITSDGMKQVMVKISSYFPGVDILSWVPSTHSKKTSPPNFADWNIVDIRCRLPSCTSFMCGNLTANLSLKKLRYFSMEGPNQIADMSRMFQRCFSLTAIPELDTSKATDMSYMFYYCYSLTSIPKMDTSLVTNMKYMFGYATSIAVIPELDTAQVTDMSYMFNYCYGISSIPKLDTSAVTNMAYMFAYCYNLTSVPEFDTSKVTMMNYMFYYCYSLTSVPKLNTALVTSMANMFNFCNALVSIPQLDTSKTTNMASMFAQCYSLASVTLNPDVPSWAGYAISLADSSLSYAAIVALLNSLPALTVNKTLTLTGNPGVSELTDADKAIATDKQWTLTL